MDFEYILGCMYFGSWLGSLMWVSSTTPLALGLLIAGHRWALIYLAVLVGLVVCAVVSELDRAQSSSL